MKSWLPRAAKSPNFKTRLLVVLLSALVWVGVGFLLVRVLEDGFALGREAG